MSIFVKKPYQSVSHKRKLFQISPEVNTGSVGRIAEQIGLEAKKNGWDSYIAYGRESRESDSVTIKIGNKKDVYFHALSTRIFDNHAFESKRATKELVNRIREIEPDIIHLHHLHGYYINIKILFSFLKEYNYPTIWTFHDCWSYTGHCAYYEWAECYKWQTECKSCPQKTSYPKSLFIDRSSKNFKEKNKIFNSLENLTIVPVSKWIGSELKKSFLSDNRVFVIQNGIDIKTFKPVRVSLKKTKMLKDLQKFIILGVASTWDERKGLFYFKELASKLDDIFQIVLIGLSKKQIKSLPKNIIGFERTESTMELAEFYSLADVFVNPTLDEALSLTNLEAQSCGTPVVTFDSGGTPETITELTGFTVERGNINGLIDGIKRIKENGKDFYSESCRENIISNFDASEKFLEYINLYKSLIK